jgi:hypothetical protein
MSHSEKNERKKIKGDKGYNSNRAAFYLTADFDA